MVDIPDVFTYTIFCDHRLRGFRLLGVKFSLLSLTFIVALILVQKMSLIKEVKVKPTVVETVAKFMSKHCLVKNNNMNSLLHFTEEQQTKLLDVLDKYTCCFSDKPRLC